jgi:hypothetical protein
MQPNHWLPLTEYALRSGMSISTLRRKIKSNSIEYRMEEGRYLIRSDDLLDDTQEAKPAHTPFAFSSSDQVLPKQLKQEAKPPLPPKKELPVQNGASAELEVFRQEMKKVREEDLLRWRALEARVSGVARKLDMFSEQISELKMLVKIFEEKLDAHS